MNLRRGGVSFGIVLLLLIGNAGVGMAQPGTDCLIKGIVGSTGLKMYLLPGHSLYDKVAPDPNKGEQWFCEAAGAERAGFVFVPDPVNPTLRPQTAAPTPLPPPPTPEPQPTAVIETPEAVPETATPTPPEPEAAAPPPPEPPTATPEPVEVVEPQLSGDLPAADPFSQPGSPGTSLDPLPDWILGQLPPEAHEALRQLPPEALAMMAGVLAWIPVMLGLALLIVIMTVVVRWKLFVKAGEPGWAAIIPIFSEVLMLKIAGLAWWWILIGIIPVIGQVAFLVVWVFVRPFKTAANFGYGLLYGLGLLVFPLSPLFWLHLAFGGAEYTGG